MPVADCCGVPQVEQVDWRDPKVEQGHFQDLVELKGERLRQMKQKRRNWMKGRNLIAPAEARRWPLVAVALLEVFSVVLHCLSFFGY